MNCSFGNSYFISDFTNCERGRFRKRQEHMCVIAEECPGTWGFTFRLFAYHSGLLLPGTSALTNRRERGFAALPWVNVCYVFRWANRGIIGYLRRIRSFKSQVRP